jgi:hypothetical protein
MTSKIWNGVEFKTPLVIDSGLMGMHKVQIHMLPVRIFYIIF